MYASSVGKTEIEGFSCTNSTVEGIPSCISSRGTMGKKGVTSAVLLAKLWEKNLISWMLGSCFAWFLAIFRSEFSNSRFVLGSPASSWADRSLLKWFSAWTSERNVSGSAWPLLFHMLPGHCIFTSGLSVCRGKTTENHGTPTKHVKCANATCLGALISGHSMSF